MKQVLNQASASFFLYLILFTSPLSGQSMYHNCNVSLLNEGVEFKADNPKDLEGLYKLIIVPEWDSEAEVSRLELTLIWEEQYEELESNRYNAIFVKNPLIGFIDGDIKKSTVTNLSGRLSSSDPFNPALRFFTESKTLRFPGGKVDPECVECLHIETGITGFELKIERAVNGMLVGEWIESLGMFSTKNSEGDLINKSTGYFCAKLKS